MYPNYREFILRPKSLYGIEYLAILKYSVWRQKNNIHRMRQKEFLNKDILCNRYVVSRAITDERFFFE